ASTGGQVSTAGGGVSGDAAVVELVRRLVGSAPGVSVGGLGFAPGVVLKAQQVEGVAWLAYRARWGLGGILADDMGLGKTLQVIALHLYLRSVGVERRSLVVVPASLLEVWRGEFVKFAPGVSVEVMGGPGVPAAEVVLVSYGVMKG